MLTTEELEKISQAIDTINQVIEKDITLSSYKAMSKEEQKAIEKLHDATYRFTFGFDEDDYDGDIGEFTYVSDAHP